MVENKFFLYLMESDACNEQYCPDHSLAVGGGGMLTPGLVGILVVDCLQAKRMVCGLTSPLRARQHCWLAKCGSPDQLAVRS